MKNYTERFEQINTLKGLFDFRDELEADARANKGAFDNGINEDMLYRCQEANWHKQIVEIRIKHLVMDGESLDTIKEVKPQ